MYVVYAQVLLEILNAHTSFSSYKLCLEVKLIGESVRSSGSICCLTFMQRCWMILIVELSTTAVQR